MALSAREIRERARQAGGDKGRVSAREQAESHGTGFNRTRLLIPDGVNLYTPKVGNNQIEVIIYIVPENGWNLTRKPGFPAYELTYWAHRDVGPNGDWYICAAKMASKPCPICEHRHHLVKVTSADDKDGQKLITALLPKERQLWNVYDYDQADKGVQVWDISYHLFGKALNARITTSREDKEYEFFSDPEAGMTLDVGMAEKSSPFGKFIEAASIDFTPRGALPDALLEAAHTLDKLLIVPGVTTDLNGKLVMTYDKLKEIFLQIGDEDEGGGEPKKDKPADKPAGAPAGAITRPPPRTTTPPPADKPAAAPQVAEKPKAAPATGTAPPQWFASQTPVVHATLGPCIVMKNNGDGTYTVMSEVDDELHKGVKHAELRPKANKAAKAEPKAEAPPPVVTSPEGDGDGDWGDQDTATAVASTSEPEAADGDWDAGWTEDE